MLRVESRTQGFEPLQNTGRALDSRQRDIEHRIAHPSLVALGIWYSSRHFGPMLGGR